MREGLHIRRQDFLNIAQNKSVMMICSHVIKLLFSDMIF